MRFPRSTRGAIALALLCPLAACGGLAPSAALARQEQSPEIASMSSGSAAPRAPAAADEAGVAPAPPRSARELPAATAAAHAAEGPTPAEPGALTATATTATAAAQMLIYTGNVSLAVESVPRALDQVVEVALSAGGFLAARSDASVQVRVPSARFRDVMNSVEHLGDVTHHDVQAEDVSEAYHDLEVQLANLRAVRARLQEFLARAANVQDALAVERELERVSGQIDQIEGRLRFLADRVTLSTLNVAVATRANAPNDPGPAAPDANVPLPFGWLDRVGLPNLLRLH